jgi:hypothetical protein
MQYNPRIAVLATGYTHLQCLTTFRHRPNNMPLCPWKPRVHVENRVSCALFYEQSPMTSAACTMHPARTTWLSDNPLSLRTAAAAAVRHSPNRYWHQPTPLGLCFHPLYRCVISSGQQLILRAWRCFSIQDLFQICCNQFRCSLFFWWLQFTFDKNIIFVRLEICKFYYRKVRQAFWGQN